MILNLPAELTLQITGYIKSKNAELFATIDKLATGQMEIEEAQKLFQMLSDHPFKEVVGFMAEVEKAANAAMSAAPSENKPSDSIPPSMPSDQ